MLEILKSTDYKKSFRNSLQTKYKLLDNLLKWTKGLMLK